MGRLVYHRDHVFSMEDEVLSHVEAVITTKLRRGEPFMLMIDTSASEGGGRVTIWVNKASTLVYRYRDNRTRLTADRLEAFMTAANSPGGLRLRTEESPVSNVTA